MEKTAVLNALKELRTNSPKRKFTQSVDLIINLNEVNIKSDAGKINTFLKLPYPLGKKIRTTALIGKELIAKAKESCSNVVHLDEFKSLAPKQIKKLASETDFFIAQANIMPQVAAAFGKIIGSRGKMPNPKAGCVIPPTAEIKPLIDQLSRTVRLETKNEPTLKTSIGLESLKDEELAENIIFIYNSIIHNLPRERENIKSIMIKLTMGKPVMIGLDSRKK